MNINTIVECPYCGFEFTANYSINVWDDLKGQYQVCPDDEFDGACGNVFYLDLEMKLKPTNYYAIPKMVYGLQAGELGKISVDISKGKVTNG